MNEEKGWIFVKHKKQSAGFVFAEKLKEAGGGIRISQLV